MIHHVVQFALRQRLLVLLVVAFIAIGGAIQFWGGLFIPLWTSLFSRRTISPISRLILSTRFQDREVSHNVHLVKRVESDDARCRVCALHA